MDEPVVERDVTSRTATDELTARVAAHRTDIDALQARFAAADDRADVRQARADVSRRRAVESGERLDMLEARAGGVVMASRRVNEDEAFDQLVRASNDTNRKLRAIAADVVRTRDLSALPSA